MNLQNFLSQKGQFLEKNVDLSAGTLAWNTYARQKTKELPDFINATIGSATENDGSLMVYPSMVEEFNRLSGDELFKYANVWGLTSFVEVWKKDTLETYPSNIAQKADNLSTLPVTSCGGLTSGLMISSQLFFDKNEPILVPNARWGNVDNVFFRNRQLKEITYDFLDNEGNLYFAEMIDTLKDLEKTEKKAGLYLNFPNNPSGISPTMNQVKALQEAISDISIPIVIFIDDAYEGYVYEEDVLNHSIFPHLIGLNENVLAVKIDGVSKRFCAYGARLGLVSIGFGEEVSDEKRNQTRELIAKAARTNTSSSPRGIQEVLTVLLNDKEKREKVRLEKARNLGTLKNRYNKIKDLIKEKENGIFKPAKFNSGFFSFFTIENHQTANEIAKILLNRGLGTVPFYNESNDLNGIRLAFCSIADEDIERAISILYSIE